MSRRRRAGKHLAAAKCSAARSGEFELSSVGKSSRVSVSGSSHANADDQGENSPNSKTASSQMSPSWPDSLEKFVVECNLRVANDSEKAILLGQQLPRLLQLAIDSDSIHTNDWDNQKIPVLDGVPTVALAGSIPMKSTKYVHDEEAPYIINHPWVSAKHDLNASKRSLGVTPVKLEKKTLSAEPSPKVEQVPRDSCSLTFASPHIPEDTVGVTNDIPGGTNTSSNISCTSQAPKKKRCRSRNPAYSSSTLTSSSRLETADYVIDVTPSEEKFVAPVSKRDADFELSERKRRRAQRFEACSTPPPVATYKESGPLRPVVGTCQTLEKSYLRLTSEPDPSRVRPEPVLKQALAHVTRIYERDHSYLYALDQFKSLRQDLTVQNIRNSFSVLVYESNARVLLVNNDLGEFNQCQTQLQELYKSVSEPAYEAVMARSEFFAYRIIYMILTRNDADLVRCRAQYFDDSGLKQDPDPRRPWHAFIRALLRVHVVDRLGDYSALFSLIAPFHEFELLALAMRLLESHVLYKVRARALLTMSRAYRKLPMSMLQSLLHLDSEHAIMALFASLKILYTINEAREWDCAAARPLLVQLIASQGFNKVDLKGQV